MATFHFEVKEIGQRLSDVELEKLKRVVTVTLEAGKKYNKDVKYGYAKPSSSNDHAEFLRYYEEDIKEFLKHQDQMRHWEMYVNGRPLGSRRDRPE
ncbi:hypothetical protein Tco_0256458 [Tanacetum coccineum]